MVFVLTMNMKGECKLEESLLHLVHCLEMEEFLLHWVFGVFVVFRGYYADKLYLADGRFNL